MAHDDDIIEISFDDDDTEDDTATPSSDDVIEITFNDMDEPKVASPKASARLDRAPADDDVEDETRYCPDCGFALPPLAKECPRCARVGGPPRTNEPGGTPAEYSPVDGSNQPYAPHRPRRHAFWGALLSLGLIIVVALLVAWYLVNSPGARARAAYRDGVEAQLAGDMVTARAKYREALEIDPKMGLAAFAAGTAYLGITVGDSTGQTLETLMDRATFGETQALDEADRWFDYAIALASEMPENRTIQDASISTPAKLGAYSHAMKSFTALIRYVAALNADSFDIAGQWLAVASREWQLCLRLDPTNPYGAEFGEHFPGGL